MKAIVYTEYGSPDVLHIAEIDKPRPKDNELLVRVYATNVNFGDLLARNFNAVTPRTFSMPGILWLPTVLAFGARKPRKSILGSEFAGKVEAVGSSVTQFKVGDDVFGYRSQSMGANVEYLVVAEDSVTLHMPTDMSYEEAATLPYGAITAYNLLRIAKVQARQKVLINGASGGIGSFAVQLAKYYGAEVTGVASTQRLELVKSLGADYVIDYTQEDFTQNGEIYDLILDVTNKSSFAKAKNSLTPNGRYLLGSFKMKQVFQMLRTSFGTGKKVICGLSGESREDFIAIKELIDAGAIKPFVDRCFPMEQAADAHRHAESREKRGSVVITYAV